MIEIRSPNTPYQSLKPGLSGFSTGVISSPYGIGPGSGISIGLLEFIDKEGWFNFTNSESDL